MITVYEIYNRFDNYTYTKTTSETEAYEICGELNKPFEDVDPVDRPWGICSRIMADRYTETLGIK